MADQGAMFDEFVQTGFLDDADIKVTSARFVQWDYLGTVSPPVLALQLKMLDSDSKEHTDHLSAGDLKFFVPSSDGKKAIPVGKQTKLNINTNAAEFIISIINADTRGELAAKIKTTDDISLLDGMRAHVSRVAQKKRENITNPAAANVQGVTRTPTVLKVDKILAYPWETGTVTASAPAPAAAAAAPVGAAAPAAGAGPNDETAQSILVEILATNGGSLAKNAIAGKAFSLPSMQALLPAQKNSVLALIVKEDFLLSAGVAAMGISYDKAAGVVKLG